MDGWIDGQMVRWVDGWIDRQTDRQICEHTNKIDEWETNGNGQNVPDRYVHPACARTQTAEHDVDLRSTS